MIPNMHQKMNIRLRLIYSAVFCSLFNFSFCQRSDTLGFFGFNIVSLIPFPSFSNINQNYTFEPIIKVPIVKNTALWRTSFGYSHYSKYPVYNNLDYKSSGYFIKTGFESNSNCFFCIGVLFCISQYEDHGKFILPGNYYDNYIVDFKKRDNFNGYVEPYFSLKLDFVNTVIFEIDFSLDVLIINKHYDIPVYYMPGIGVYPENNIVNGNIALKLFLKL